MRRMGSATSIVAVVFLGGCGGGGSPNAPTATLTPPEQLLSATGLYTDIARKQIDPRNRPWVPQYPLWSDGSEKERWISLPPGTRIDTTDMDRWVFPVGTKIWKEFGFLGKRVETRLIEKVSAEPGLNGWSFRAFQWRPDESDAVLASASGVKGVAPTSFGTSHDIPSVDECKLCHNRGGDVVAGFDVLQVSADRDPLAIEAGRLAPGDITLEDLMRENLLTRNPDSQPRIPSSSAVARWSMGVLHGNCGNCHNAQGAVASIGMDLRHTVTAQREEDEPIYRTAVNRLTMAYTQPGTTSGVDSYRILGGSPEKSAVLFRMQNRGNFHAMPPIGSKVVDADAVNMVTEWIRGLPRK